MIFQVAKNTFCNDSNKSTLSAINIQRLKQKEINRKEEKQLSKIMWRTVIFAAFITSEDMT